MTQGRLVAGRPAVLAKGAAATAAAATEVPPSECPREWSSGALSVTESAPEDHSRGHLLGGATEVPESAPEDHSRGHLLHGASCEVLCGVSCKWIYGESCGLMRGVSCEVLCGASCKWIYGESCGLLLQSCCCGFRSCWHSALFIISSPFELLSPFPRPALCASGCADHEHDMIYLL